MSGNEHLLALIEARRAELGLTQAQLGQLAFGKADTAAIQNLKRGASPTFDRLKALADALGLELYFGPPRERRTVKMLSTSSADSYVPVPLHDAELAAGDGHQNLTEGVVDRLAFRRDWLTKVGVSSSSARLARVKGDSMAPTVVEGDMVLIDTSRADPPVRERSKTDKRRSPIFAIRENGEARIKRIERPAADRVILLSDNPEFAPEVLTGSEVAGLSIIGKVVWWGHTVKE